MKWQYFTESSDENRCKLNSHKRSLDQNISTFPDTLYFRQARAMLLIGLSFCSCSVDSRCHVSDGKTKYCHRCFLIGSLAINLSNQLRCETQIHCNRGGHNYMAWHLCNFVAKNLHKSIWRNITNHKRKITQPNGN